MLAIVCRRWPRLILDPWRQVCLPKIQHVFLAHVTRAMLSASVCLSSVLACPWSLCPGSIPADTLGYAISSTPFHVLCRIVRRWILTLLFVTVIFNSRPILPLFVVCLILTYLLFAFFVAISCYQRPVVPDRTL